MRIHVCPLSQLEVTVRETGASHLVTLVNPATPMTRPAAIVEANHLTIALSDIAVPTDGHVLPAAEHVERYLAFLDGWDRAAPMVVHCWAGVSRSTAAAYVAACALDPGRDEREAALALRQASPTATPNPLIVALADARLGRSGRMIEAVAAIGRGAECFEGSPFAYRV